MSYTRTLTPTPFLFLVAGLAIGAGFLQRESIGAALQAGAATLLACAVSATLPWWRRQQGGVTMSTGELVCFAALLVIGTSILLSRKSAAPTGRVERTVTFGLYCAIAAYCSFSQASLADPGELWHHWGAYVGPSELVLAGARLFHDIPAQYGAGPTLLLAFACGADCWSAAYWVFGLATFAYAVLIGALAWSARSGERYRDLLLLLLCTVACTFWIAYPPAAASAVVWPSVGGMRFLPAVMLTAWILFTANRDAATRTWGGHVLWVAGALWSPESAFCVTAIWWPVYLLDVRGPGPLLARYGAILRALGRLLGLAIGTIVVATLLYRIAYGVFPVPRYILAYALYPPGPLPIDPHGTIWYFGFVLALSVSVSWSTWRRTGDVSRFRRSLTLQLLAFSAFSYYLGRSHDNNILNLMPFLVLVLLDSLAGSVRLFVRHALALGLASILAWTTVFGWQAWRDAFQAGRLTDFSFAATRGQLAYHDAATAEKLAKRIDVTSTRKFEQAGKLMDFLFQRGEPFMVLDVRLNLQPRYSGNAWSAIHGPANFRFIPSSMRREFLLQTAQRLGRDGWVIVDRNYDADPWLADYDAVYQRTHRIDLDTYYAIRYALGSSTESIAQ